MTTRSIYTVLRTANRTSSGDEPWQLRSHCGPKDDAVMYPREVSSHEAYDEGRDICKGCPVADRCLDEAMADEGLKGTQYRYGLRGGYDPMERLQLARMRAKEGAA